LDSLKANPTYAPALTSFPPGETASEPQLKAIREAIDRAFRQAGVLEVRTEMGLFLSRKRS